MGVACSLQPLASPIPPPISLAPLGALSRGPQGAEIPAFPGAGCRDSKTLSLGEALAPSTQGGRSGHIVAVSCLSHLGLRVGRSLRCSHHKCPDTESQRTGRASFQRGLGNLSCRQALRSPRERSADVPEDHSSCPQPSPALPRLFPASGYGAAYVTGWQPGAELGALAARDGLPPPPTVRPSLRAPVPHVDVCGGSSQAWEESLGTAWWPPAHFHFLPPNLAWKMTQSPPSHGPEATKQRLLHP